MRIIPISRDRSDHVPQGREREGGGGEATETAPAGNRPRRVKATDRDSGGQTGLVI